MIVMRENGVVLVVLELTLPAPSSDDVGKKRIAAFYNRLEEEAKQYAERLFATAKDEYNASPDPRKRFTFPHYRLHLSCKVTEESDDFFSVLRDIHLTRGGKLLAHCRQAELFFRKTGLLCPPLFLRLSGYRIPRGRNPLYRENGEFHRLSPVSSYALASSVNSKSASSGR